MKKISILLLTILGFLTMGCEMADTRPDDQQGYVQINIKFPMDEYIEIQQNQGRFLAMDTKACDVIMFPADYSGTLSNPPTQAEVQALKSTPPNTGTVITAGYYNDLPTSGRTTPITFGDAPGSYRILAGSFNTTVNELNPDWGTSGENPVSWVLSDPFEIVANETANLSLTMAPNFSATGNSKIHGVTLRGPHGIQQHTLLSQTNEMESLIYYVDGFLAGDNYIAINGLSDFANPPTVNFYNEIGEKLTLSKDATGGYFIFNAPTGSETLVVSAHVTTPLPTGQVLSSAFTERDRIYDPGPTEWACSILLEGLVPTANLTLQLSGMLLDESTLYEVLVIPDSVDTSTLSDPPTETEVAALRSSSSVEVHALSSGSQVLYVDSQNMGVNKILIGAFDTGTGRDWSKISAAAPMRTYLMSYGMFNGQFLEHGSRTVNMSLRPNLMHYSSSGSAVNPAELASPHFEESDQPARLVLPMTNFAVGINYLEYAPEAPGLAPIFSSGHDYSYVYNNVGVSFYDQDGFRLNIMPPPDPSVNPAPYKWEINASSTTDIFYMVMDYRATLGADTFVRLGIASDSDPSNYALVGLGLIAF